MKKILFYLLVCVLLILPAKGVLAQTPVNTLISNYAIVEGDNFTAEWDAVNDTVELIAGGEWPAGLDITNAIGGDYTNLSKISNLGNGTINFQIGVGNWASNAGFCGGTWTYDIYTNGDAYMTGESDNTAPTGAVPLDSGDVVNVMMIVHVAAGISSGWQRYQLYATSADPYQNNATYVGDNATQYGGSLTTGWGEVNLDQLVINGTGVLDAGGDFVWTIEGAGAITIIISKTIASISDVGFGLGICIPGATITYNLRVTNSSGGMATGVVVKDIFDTNNLVYVGGSMSVAGGNEALWTPTQVGNLVKWTNISVSGAIEGGNWADLQFSAIIK